MSKIASMFKQLRRKLKGSLAVAIEDGMTVESGVTVMGGVGFGSEPYLITLRKNVRISSNVTFITHDGGTWAFRNYWEEYGDVIKYGCIEVGEGSFVGANSTVLPGVTIGHHSVIGAGSVVTKDVPAETVWAGVPAKQVCTLKEYAEKCEIAMQDQFGEINKEHYDKDKKAFLIEAFGRNKR